MSNYKLTLDVKSENKYTNARKDLIKAWHSLQQLDFDQKNRLFTEFFGPSAPVIMQTIENLFTMR